MMTEIEKSEDEELELLLQFLSDCQEQKSEVNQQRGFRYFIEEVKYLFTSKESSVKNDDIIKRSEAFYCSM